MKAKANLPKTAACGHRRELAVAISHERDTTPRVSYSGEGEVAKLMRQVALRFGVPIRFDDRLADKLAPVGHEEEIPEELYRAVARLLCDLDEQ